MYPEILNFVDTPSLFYVVASTGLLLLLTGNFRPFGRGIRLLFTRDLQISAEESREMAELFRFVSRINLSAGLIWGIVGFVNVLSFMNFEEPGALAYLLSGGAVAVLPLFYALILNAVFILPAIFRFQKQSVRVLPEL